MIIKMTIIAIMTPVSTPPPELLELLEVLVLRRLVLVVVAVYRRLRAEELRRRGSDSVSSPAGHASRRCTSAAEAAQRSLLHEATPSSARGLCVPFPRTEGVLP
jgi:hypothetical protein